MADPKSKIRWDKDNVHQVAAKLFMTKDDDREIWEFLQQQPSMAMTIKDALRAYMKAQKASSAAQPTTEEKKVDYSALFEDEDDPFDGLFDEDE